MKQLQGVAEFIAVVEMQGFSTAAKGLGISKACVSQRVAALEERLGTRLLQRTTRRLALTEAGELFYRHAREGLRELALGEERVRDFQESFKGPIRLSMVDGGLGEWHLAPAVARFAALHPGVSIEIDLSSRLVDLTAEGFDFAIRVGDLADSSLIARRLTAFRYGLYASPEYLKAHGVPMTPEDLKGHNCLSGAAPRWSLQCGDRRTEVVPRGSWHSKSGQALVAAAAVGLGIARAATFYARQPLAAGEVVEVLADWTRQETPVWIVYPSSRHLPRRVSGAIHYLLETFKGAPHWE